MSELNVANVAFTKVQDTVYDSKLMDGLAKLGVLPKSFQAIQAVLDVSKVTVADDGVAAAGVLGVGEAGRFLDVNTGEPVILATGQQVVLCQAVVTTDVAGGSLSIGLAVAGTSDTNTTPLTAATTAAVLNPNGAGLVNPGNLVAAAHYLKGAATLSPVTAGVVQVLLIVV